MSDLKPHTRAELLELNRAHSLARGMYFHSLAGICWSCGGDLVAYYGEAWATAQPTGCPLCHRSYCD